MTLRSTIGGRAASALRLRPRARLGGDRFETATAPYLESEDRP